MCCLFEDNFTYKDIRTALGCQLAEAAMKNLETVPCFLMTNGDHLQKAVELKIRMEEVRDLLLHDNLSTTYGSYIDPRLIHRYF